MDTWSTVALGGLNIILAFWFKIRNHKKDHLVDDNKIEVAALKTDDYLKRYYPGRKVVNVEPDGCCMTRAISCCLFKDDKHCMLLSKAVNEFIRENLPIIGEWLSFPMSLKLGASGQEILVKNDGEYLEFLKRNDALYLWRDYWDLVALCELLHMRITVLRAEGDYIQIVQKIEPISAKVTEEDDRIVLLLKSEHYYAIVHPTDAD